MSTRAVTKLSQITQEFLTRAARFLDPQATWNKNGTVWNRDHLLPDHEKALEGLDLLFLDFPENQRHSGMFRVRRRRMVSFWYVRKAFRVINSDR